MTNPFYNSTMVAVPDTLIRSQATLTQFNLVGAGFDAVKAALDLKAPAASPTLTGSVDMSTAVSVRVPTVALSESDLTRAASIGFALNVLGAAGALIPPQAGHAGKALVSDGTSYSWQFVVPSPTGQAGKTPRVNSAGTGYELRNATALGDGGIAVENGNAVADATQTILDLSAASAGTLVTLPDARTLPVGFSYIASQCNTGANLAGVVDAAGTLLYAANTTTGTGLVLTDNTTLAGTWRLLSSSFALSSPSGVRVVLSAQTTTSTGLSFAAKGVFPVGNDEFLMVSGRSNDRTVLVQWVRADGLQLTVKAQTTLGATGATAVGSILVRAVTGGYLITWTITGGSEIVRAAIVQLVDGGTPSITAGATVDLATSAAPGVHFDAAVNANKILWAWAGAAGAGTVRAASYSGTTITLGTANTLFTGGTTGNTYLSLAAMPEADKFVLAAGRIADTSDVGIYARVVTLSGETITLQATATVTGSTYGHVRIKAVSSSRVWLAYKEVGVATASIVALTITGNVVAIDTPVAVLSGLSTSGAAASLLFFDLFNGNASALIGYGVNSVAFTYRSATLSGATVTPGAAQATTGGTTSHLAAVSPFAGLGWLVSNAATGARFISYAGADGGDIATGVQHNVGTLGHAQPGQGHVDLLGTRFAAPVQGTSTTVSVRAAKVAGI